LKPEKGVVAGFDAGSALEDAGGKLNSDFCPPEAAAGVAPVFDVKRLLVLGGFVVAWLLVKEKGVAGAVVDAGTTGEASVFG